MRKRFLSVLVVLCMVLTMLPTAAFAADEQQDVTVAVEFEKATPQGVQTLLEHIQANGTNGNSGKYIGFDG